MKNVSFILTINVILAFGIYGQIIQSPCPAVFQYRIDRKNREYFGFVQLRNLKPGQVVKLLINLSIPAQLPTNYPGSIEIIGDRTTIFNDIVSRRPAKYRVNFPLKNVIPRLLEVNVNGHSICTGPPSIGQVVTNINLEHTLYTQLQTQALKVNFPHKIQDDPLEGDGPFDGDYDNFQSRTLPYQKPYYPPREQPSMSIGTRPSVESGESDFSCGVPENQLTELIFGGKSSKRGQWPWMTAIYLKEENAKTKFICGGTLVSNKIVVTAGHCLHSKDFNRRLRAKEVLVSPGRYNIDDFTEDSPFANALTVIIHPDFKLNYVNYDADIGLIILKRNIQFSKFVKPICLWEEKNDLEDIIGSKGKVIGWGRTESGLLSSEPKASEISIVSNSECLAQDKLFWVSTSTRTFCAGGQGTGPCDGDSGTGFVMRRNGKFTLRGIVSHSLKDPNTEKCDMGKYAVFTDVAKFTDWITDFID